MKVLNEKELSQVGGGLITKYRGNYFAVSDTGDSFFNRNSKNKQDIIDICNKYGFSTEELSPEEFEKRFGYKFEPDWVRIYD